jgi:hypothetical protein
MQEISAVEGSDVSNRTAAEDYKNHEFLPYVFVSTPTWFISSPADPWKFTLGVKWSERETNHSFPSTTKVRMLGALPLCPLRSLLYDA